MSSSVFDFKFGTFKHNEHDQPNATLINPNAASYTVPIFPVVSDSHVNVNAPLMKQEMKQKNKSYKKKPKQNIKIEGKPMSEKKNRVVKYKIEI